MSEHRWKHKMLLSQEWQPANRVSLKVSFSVRYQELAFPGNFFLAEKKGGIHHYKMWRWGKILHDDPFFPTEHFPNSMPQRVLKINNIRGSTDFQGLKLRKCMVGIRSLPKNKRTQGWFGWLAGCRLPIRISGGRTCPMQTSALGPGPSIPPPPCCTTC